MALNGYMLMLCATPFLALACGSAALTARFLAIAERGVAEVVSSRENPNARGRSWTTTFSVTASDGKNVTASWTEGRNYSPGDAVRVVYCRKPTLRIQPDDYWSAWGYAWIFATAGASLILLGGVTVLISKLRRWMRR